MHVSCSLKTKSGWAGATGGAANAKYLFRQFQIAGCAHNVAKQNPRRANSKRRFRILTKTRPPPRNAAGRAGIRSFRKNGSNGGQPTAIASQCQTANAGCGNGELETGCEAVQPVA